MAFEFLITIKLFNKYSLNWEERRSSSLIFTVIASESAFLLLLNFPLYGHLKCLLEFQLEAKDFKVGLGIEIFVTLKNNWALSYTIPYLLDLKAVAFYFLE